MPKHPHGYPPLGEGPRFSTDPNFEANREESGAGTAPKDHTREDQRYLFHGKIVMRTSFHFVERRQRREVKHGDLAGELRSRARQGVPAVRDLSTSPRPMITIHPRPRRFDLRVGEELRGPPDDAAHPSSLGAPVAPRHPDLRAKRCARRVSALSTSHVG
jgi:hypothetical protein